MMYWLLWLVACGGKGPDTGAADTAEPAAGPCDTVPGVTWANWGDGFFSTYCRACHSSMTADRFDAPESVNFDTKEDVITWAERIRVRALEEGTMPVGGGVYDDELELLGYFLDCGL